MPQRLFQDSKSKSPAAWCAKKAPKGRLHHIFGIHLLLKPAYRVVGEPAWWAAKRTGERPCSPRRSHRPWAGRITTRVQGQQSNCSSVH